VFFETPYIITNDPDELRTYHEHQLAEGLEGAVIKQLDSEYQSGRKGWNWVKIKEEEGTRGKLRDTLDCVVMGLYAGRGKRTEFGLGAFLVGVLDAEQRIKTIAKIGTGLSDEQFRELKKKTEPLMVESPPALYEVSKALVPDIWLQPSVVVEVAADEITRSPQHTAGVALRFPRLVRFREDKAWADVTTLAEVTQLSQLS
jgi:DNA ligase-1